MLKRAHNVLNLREKSKNIRFVEGWHVFVGSWMALWENESSIHSLVLNSMHPKHL
jgi:hypothetical protein